MRSKIKALALVATIFGANLAQAQPATTTAPPPVATAPTAGANSFTEGQARSRIEAAGFTNVTDLQKDSQGVWRGRAMRSGAPTDVGLDYQGNVITGNAPAR